ncbi:ABC transporter ATP-binding protein [Cellulomonas aerilata]|uniref:ABC transporter n=1 Tax=Cellulomonas aerilata TaxID=515326 RepID=A0A512DG74_9CELL|nr:ABC transporter ATP-binding protein [Cellulomonas aerilata]GEO35455.1 ABC transporter [Cellulomonas aerilata]
MADRAPRTETDTATGSDPATGTGTDHATGTGTGTATGTTTPTRTETDSDSGTETPPTPARLRDLLAYLSGHRRVLSLVLVVSVLSAGLSLAQPVVVNRVITAVGRGEPYGGGVGVLVALVVGAGVLGALQQYGLERTAEGVVLDARRRLIRRLLRLPVAEYDTRRTGDLVSRVGSDTTMLRSVLTGGLLDAVGGTLVFAGSVVAMALLDPLLLGMTVGVITVAVVSVVVASARIQVLTRQSQDAVGRVAAGVERALSAVRTVRAANATERESARLEADARSAYDLGVRIARLGAILWPVSGLAIQGAFLAVLGVGGYRVATGALTVADLVSFILFLFLMLTPLGQAFGAIASVRSALGALARIQEILDLAPESDDDGATPHLAAPAAPVDGGPTAPARHPLLAFDGVSFAYRPGEPVLSGVTLAVEAGGTTAVVGPSGAGKSTLLALAERFYDPDDGVVRLDGHDLRTLPRAALRGQIGYVEQDAPVLAGTLRDNLLLAAPAADDDACRRVLDSVNLLERVDRHPAGLDAEVGDGGVGLSGGERQRLAIARVLLAGAPLLLLDEPTASLDGRNEQAMQHALHAAARGRTVLIVAHRLATVVRADRIVVLDAGRVVGVGTHEDLLTTSPLYRELASHQLLV